MRKVENAAGMGKRKARTRNTPRPGSGLAWLKEIREQEQTGWGPGIPPNISAAVHAAGEAVGILLPIDDVDARTAVLIDKAIWWAMLAVKRQTQAEQFEAHYVFLATADKALNAKIKQHGGLNNWRQTRETVKREAADRYHAYRAANPEWPKAKALKKAIDGLDIKPRALREYLATLATS